MNDITQQEKSKYIFHQLFQKEGDYIGLIAYGLYKKNKIDYIIDFKNNNEGRKPTDEELATFQANNCLDGQIQMYKESAKNITNQFVSVLTQKESKNLQEERDGLKKIKADLDKKSKDFQKKETDLKEKDTKVKQRERDVNLREKYCKLKSPSWFKNFVVGVLQSVTASFVFLGLAILIIYVVDKKIDLLDNFRFLWKK